MVGAQVLRQLSFFNCLGKGAGEYAPFDGERLFSVIFSGARTSVCVSVSKPSPDLKALMQTHTR
jgi:hypothetical protein